MTVRTAFLLITALGASFGAASCSSPEKFISAADAVTIVSTSGPTATKDGGVTFTYTLKNNSDVPICLADPKVYGFLSIYRSSDLAQAGMSHPDVFMDVPIPDYQEVSVLPHEDLIMTDTVELKSVEFFSDKRGIFIGRPVGGEFYKVMGDVGLFNCQRGSYARARAVDEVLWMKTPLSSAFQFGK